MSAAAARSQPIHETLYRLPGHLIRRLQQAAVSIFVSELGALGHDLTPVQFGAITMTRRHPGIDQATLAGLIAYDRATIGGVVDRLVKKGLLSRQVSRADRRARTLHVTQAAVALLDEIAPQVDRVQGMILSGLDPSERTLFLALLEKATEAVNDRSRAPLRPGLAPLRRTPTMLPHEMFPDAQDTSASRAGVPAADGRPRASPARTEPVRSGKRCSSIRSGAISHRSGDAT